MKKSRRVRGFHCIIAINAHYNQSLCVLVLSFREFIKLFIFKLFWRLLISTLSNAVLMQCHCWEAQGPRVAVVGPFLGC